MKEIAAIILAAGRSRRMGKFKPLLPFGETTVIESCIKNLSAAGVEEVVVVAGFRAEDIRNQLKNLPSTIVTNDDPDSEMSVSIALGISALRNATSAVLITPADHPAVPPDVIKKLIQNWQAGAKLVQPEYSERGGHPVLIDLTHRCELMNLDPQFGLRGFFARHRGEVVRLPVNSPFVARDMDTWEDYVQLHRDVFGEPPRTI